MTRENGATHIAAVMSGDFVQRGDVAVIDKFRRARIAVDNGVDLVVELPVVFSLSPAGSFAEAGVRLLTALGVDGISFGSECGDIELLKSAAEAFFLAAAPERPLPGLKEGKNYPRTIRETVAELSGEDIARVFDSPNNTLAVEYLKAISRLKTNMETFTVRRFGAAHDGSEPAGCFASGSYLRSLIKAGFDLSAYVPADTDRAVREYFDAGRIASFENMERALLFRLRTCDAGEVLSVLGMFNRGLASRFVKAGRTAASLTEFFESVNARNQTMSAVRRILLTLCLNITRGDLNCRPPYGRVLALNERGAEILKNGAARGFPIPFGTSVKQLLRDGTDAAHMFAGLSAAASDLYGLASRNIVPCGADFTAKIEIQKNKE
jgi:predicted nucleotidyltransferase